MWESVTGSVLGLVVCVVRAVVRLCIAGILLLPVVGFENQNEVVEVSWALAGDIDRRALMGLEVDLIASCRARYRDSPACQFHGTSLE